MNTTTKPKVQRRKINQAGSLINNMMGNNATLPKVGEGATRLWYTDRDCYDVVEVSECGRYVKMEYLDAKHDKSKGEPQMGHQNWVFEKTGQFIDLEWYRGAWRIVNHQVVFTKEYMEEADKNGADQFYGIHLSKTNPKLAEQIYKGEPYPQEVVEGITRKKKVYSKINIVFGVRNYHYDWSF
jgi:hypothetical protein